MTDKLPPLPEIQRVLDCLDRMAREGGSSSYTPAEMAEIIRASMQEAVRLERERMDWLAPPHTSRFVEQENGMFRVYEDVAMQGDPRHKWQAITTRWYPTTAEAIDAAIRARSEVIDDSASPIK